MDSVQSEPSSNSTMIHLSCIYIIIIKKDIGIHFFTGKFYIFNYVFTSLNWIFFVLLLKLNTSKMEKGYYATYSNKNAIIKANKPVASENANPNIA